MGTRKENISLLTQTFNFSPISINHAYYFIKMKTGRVIKVKSKECKEFVQKIHDNINNQIIYENKLEVYIRFGFQYKNKPKRKDLDNYQKIILDALSGVVWKDDTQIYKLICEKQDIKDEDFIYIEVCEYNE